MTDYQEILVRPETKRVFNSLAKFLGMTHDELVRRMLVDYVELNNITEFFPMIEKLKDDNNED